MDFFAIPDGGPILFVQSSTYVRVQDVTIQNADNTMNGVGGGIDNAQDGTVTMSNSFYAKPRQVAQISRVAS